MGVSKHIRSGDVYSVGPEYKILWMSRSRLRVLWGLSTGGPWMHIKQYGTSLKKKWDKTIWNKFEKEIKSSVTMRAAGSHYCEPLWEQGWLHQAHCRKGREGHKTMIWKVQRGRAYRTLKIIIIIPLGAGTLSEKGQGQHSFKRSTSPCFMCIWWKNKSESKIILIKDWPYSETSWGLHPTHSECW